MTLLQHIGKLTLVVLLASCSKQPEASTFAKRAQTEETCSSISSEYSVFTNAQPLWNFFVSPKGHRRSYLVQWSELQTRHHHHPVPALDANEKPHPSHKLQVLPCSSAPHPHQSQSPLPPPPPFSPCNALLTAIGHFHIKLNEKDSDGSAQIITFCI